MEKRLLPVLIFMIFSSFFISSSFSLGEEANYDESKVRTYTLPDPLIMADGSPVATADDWTSRRRGELLDLFGREMYGVMPGVDRTKLRFEETSSTPDALEGKGTRKEIRVFFNWPEKLPKMDLLLYIPNNVERPVPAFLALNFQGNHTISDDPGIALSDSEDGTRVQGTDREAKRGAAKRRWPIELIVDRGFTLATAYYEDIDPDFFDGRQNGVHPLFAEFEKGIPDGAKAAAITAWAWGLSRGLDCLETMPEIDSKRVIVMGHSRLGKTALWAGANDPRFALVISNDSGCGGAALTRRNFGETNKIMNEDLFYWFCPNYARYADDPTKIPFDQHELIALIAPRPVYIASAQEDLWADPKGEFLAAWNADPVYRLLGTDGIGGISNEPPALNTPVGGTIRYHRRTGIHDVTDYDWERYLDFAEEKLPAFSPQ